MLMPNERESMSLGPWLERGAGGASVTCSSNAGAKGIGKGHGVAHRTPRGPRG